MAFTRFNLKVTTMERLEELGFTTEQDLARLTHDRISNNGMFDELTHAEQLKLEDAATELRVASGVSSPVEAPPPQVPVAESAECKCDEQIKTEPFDGLTSAEDLNLEDAATELRAPSGVSSPVEAPPPHVPRFMKMDSLLWMLRRDGLSTNTLELLHNWGMKDEADIWTVVPELIDVLYQQLSDEQCTELQNAICTLNARSPDKPSQAIAPIEDGCKKGAGIHPDFLKKEMEMELNQMFVSDCLEKMKEILKLVTDACAHLQYGIIMMRDFIAKLNKLQSDVSKCNIAAAVGGIAGSIVLITGVVIATVLIPPLGIAIAIPAGGAALSLAGGGVGIGAFICKWKITKATCKEANKFFEEGQEMVKKIRELISNTKFENGGLVSFVDEEASLSDEGNVSTEDKVFFASNITKLSRSVGNAVLNTVRIARGADLLVDAGVAASRVLRIGGHVTIALSVLTIPLDLWTLYNAVKSLKNGEPHPDCRRLEEWLHDMETQLQNMEFIKLLLEALTNHKVHTFQEIEFIDENNPIVSAK